MTGVAGVCERSSSPGGMDPEEGKQQPAAGSESSLAGEDVRAVSVPPRKGGRTFLELFPQLFGIPFLIVIVLVLVWVFFGAIAEDNRSVADLLRDIQAGGGHSRLQDAKAVADQLVAISMKSQRDRTFITIFHATTRTTLNKRGITTSVQ